MSISCNFHRWTLMLATLTILVAVASAQNASAPLYMDPTKPVEVRVDDLISRMSLEEKASQLINQARAIPRLQVPAYDWWSEALHGVANAGTATVFPEPIGLAATFDVPQIHEMAVVIGTEGRVKHNQAVRAGHSNIMEGLDFWSPNINIFRDPRWGRGQETYGEDPFLTGRLGVAFVTGLQGEDPKYYRVISTPKHFAVHSGPEPTRHSMDVHVSKHDMEDTYLPAFRATVIEGKAASVMCAYNRVNGEPACANTFLLQDELRGAWKFNGYVVSDCGAISNIVDGHHFTKTMPEAAAVSLKKGMDNECADFFTKITDDSDYAKYVNAVKQGLLSEKEIDLALKRLFTARMRLGLFDPPELVAYTRTPDSELDSDAHRDLALKLASESIVLLKNDGVLPFGASVRKIAVVGPLADSAKVLEGNYSGTPSRSTTALDGIRKQFGEANVTYVPGTNFLRQEVVIPSAVLSTDDGQPGLKGEYFSGKDFDGAPAVVRTDKYANLQPLHPDPAALVPPAGLKDFSVCWTGYLTPTESGRYKIGVVGELNRLWLDGELLVDDPVLHDPKTTTKTLPLEKGRRYSLKLEYAKGGIGTKLVWLPVSEDPIAEAVASARNADAVIAVVGITSQLEGEEMKVEVPGFSGGDRTSLDLPKEEEDLLEALKAPGKPVVVVLMNGSALSVNWAQQNSNAILDAWYSGEEGGTAIAQTLAGLNNPAGRLPVTFYKSVDQLPPFDDYAMKNRTYRYFQQTPLYPFGYGLSYSTFEYTALKLSAANLRAGDSLRVDVTVSNRSLKEGDEVVQLYLSFPTLPGAPLRALRAFQRVHLASHESRPLSFDLGPRDLSLVNEAGDRMVAPGMYRVSVGGGQPGTGVPTVEAPLTIHETQRLPD
jgi:beta-glucosidase